MVLLMPITTPAQAFAVVKAARLSINDGRAAGTAAKPFSFNLPEVAA
jgi:hypothetical protein